MPKPKPLARPDLWNDLQNRSREMNELNDCTVKAVAIAAGVDYKVAHDAMKKHGRKERKGHCGTWQALNDLGFATHLVDPSEIIKTFPGRHAELKSLTTYHPARFPGSFDPDKVYLLFTRGHVACVRGGQTIDWSVDRPLRVQSIFEVRPHTA